MQQTYKMIALAMLLGIAMPVFAESAPVYDADDLSQSMDAPLQQQDLPPPPSPSQDGGFMSNDSLPPAPAPASAANNMAPQPSLAPSSMSTAQRLKKLEDQVANIHGVQSSAQLETLQTEIQSLRNQVEQLTHKLDQLQAQQKTMYSDLDKRVSQPGVKGAAKSATDDIPAERAIVTKTATTTKPKETTEEQPNVAEEQQTYQTAYNLIKAKKYNEAVSALQNMLKKYPSGQFASNAHYWLGELYGLVGKHDQALTEFETVVTKFPDSPRVSDAQLKIGLIYATQSKWSDAKSSFKKVINRYPGTASARLASEQLKQIKQAGH